MFTMHDNALAVSVITKQGDAQGPDADVFMMNSVYCKATGTAIRVSGCLGFRVSGLRVRGWGLGVRV